MRTSVDLPDHLFALAKQKAAKDGVSLRDIFIDSLSHFLIESPPRAPAALAPGEAFRVPVMSGSGGMLPGIDPTDSSALLELE